MKKRILFCGEASWLSTGYATYNKEIIKRLFATNKYEIAEMGAYGASNSPEAQKLPWKFYGVLPLNKREEEIYKSNQKNQFGGYKFDSIVVDFQPDIIFEIRDPWMFDYIFTSRYRDNYRIILMPTVDSAPQRREWVDELIRKADVVTTYSKFGKQELEKYGIKVSAVTSPGVDLNIFKPMDKAKVRSDWGLNNELKIIGTVMRNQKRKLFPELFESYALLREKYGSRREVAKSILLCHTSWPDVGWDIPELLSRSKIQQHVIFTYICDSCNKVFFSWFLPSAGKNGLGKCIFCGEMSAHMPSTHRGVTDAELAEIYNLMDIYVQPAICEGWGMPIVESKSCGIPGLYSNYSAMEDHVNNGGGLPIKIDRLYTEAETMAKRSLPDINDMMEGMKTLLINCKKRNSLGVEARVCCEKMHNWNITQEKFEEILDKISVKDRKYTWGARPKIRFHPQYKLANMENPDFIRWCYNMYLDREPDEKGFKDWMDGIQKGRSRNDIELFFANEMLAHNSFEEVRWNKYLESEGLNKMPFIEIHTDKAPGILI